MVIVSHDREFLDQLCTKIVETELGTAETYKGNYTQYIASKAEKNAQQYSAYEKQQKEIVRLVGICPISSLPHSSLFPSPYLPMIGRPR